jgi:cytoskeletal protein RodZ
MKFSKLNLKTIVLVALFVFYLVILLSNLFVREGLENNETPDKKEEKEEGSDETTATPTAEPSEESFSSNETKPAGTTKPKNKETTKPKK